MTQAARNGCQAMTQATRDSRIPEFSHEARGTTADWNKMDMWWECKQTKWKFWEKIERARQHKPVADVATIIRFLVKRKDAEGRPVIEGLGSPQPQADGLWRLRWLEFTDDDILMLERHGLDKAWHGCKLEALYSILYHGRLRESRKLGDRWLQGLPGVYVYKPQTARTAENYMRFTPLCKDGV